MSDHLRRFWEKVHKADDGCWLWMAARFDNGYGMFQVDGKARRAHRVAYEALVGEIPEGLHLDHLCHTRECVNPAHLEPVTCQENLLRGETVNARNAAKTECVNGHPFTPENTYLRPAGARSPRRMCRECHRQSAARHRARSKA